MLLLLALHPLYPPVLLRVSTWVASGSPQSFVAQDLLPSCPPLPGAQGLSTAPRSGHTRLCLVVRLGEDHSASVASAFMSRKRGGWVITSYGRFEALDFPQLTPVSRAAIEKVGDSESWRGRGDRAPRTPLGAVHSGEAAAESGPAAPQNLAAAAAAAP